MREAVAYLPTCHGISERLACRVIDADRKSARYRSTRDDDAGLRKKLRELANQRLSPSAHPLASGGDHDQPQEDPEALP